MNMNVKGFTKWVEEAATNDRTVYYEGYLPIDRVTNIRINAIADAAMEEARLSRIALFQRRINTNRYQYFAIRTNTHIHNKLNRIGRQAKKVGR